MQNITTKVILGDWGHSRSSAISQFSRAHTTSHMLFTYTTRKCSFTGNIHSELLMPSVDWRSNGEGVGLATPRSRVQLLAGKLFTHTYLSAVLVLVAGRWCPATGKVTVGLASHWPCVTALSGLHTYGLTGLVMEMSISPMLC